MSTDRVIRNASDTPGIGSLYEENNVVVGAGGWTEKRFVQVGVGGIYDQAVVDSAFVVGVSNENVLAGITSPFDSTKLVTVTADCVLAARDDVKSGIGGRATKYNSQAVTLDAAFTGAATSVTQPGAATLLQIFQAGDVAGDRGRVVRIIGGDALGAVIYEDIALNSTNTTTIVPGTVSFTSVAGAYMLDGAVAGAQNITIEESDTTNVCIILGASAAIGFDIHASAPVEVHCAEITSVGPNGDATWVTYFGELVDGTLGGDRVQYNAATPSVALGTEKFRTFIGVCTGEATNAGTFLTVATVADSADEKVGFVTAAVTARGNDAIVVFDIDAVNAPNVTALTAQVATNTADIATNTGDIATNTGDIATNVGDIAANAADILALQTQVSINEITATGNIAAKRFVGISAGTFIEVDEDATNVVAMSVLPIVGAATGTVNSSTIGTVEASCPLTAGDVVKAGDSGRVSKYNGTAVTLDAAAAGTATAFTQPGAPTALEVFQIADVPGDRGRVVRVVGSDALGDAIWEDFTLDAANTTTVVVGTESFTKVCGAFMLDGLVSGAQNITIRETDDTGVATLVGGQLGIGMEVPATTIQAYCQEVAAEGPNGDATFVTYMGLLTTGVVGAERGTLDAASPSKFTTTAKFVTVTNILTGEFTNAANVSTKTNATTDTTAMRVGVNVATVAARGDDALIIFKPNIGF